MAILSWDGNSSLPSASDGDLVQVTGATRDGWNGLVLLAGDELTYRTSFLGNDQTYVQESGFRLTHMVPRNFDRSPIAIPKVDPIDYRDLSGLALDIDFANYDSGDEEIPELISGENLAVTSSPATAALNADGSLRINQDEFTLGPTGFSIPTTTGDEHSMLCLMKVERSTAIPTAWATSTAYVVDDVVTESGSEYICLEAHTSGTFATDLAADKWIQQTSSYCRIRAGASGEGYGFYALLSATATLDDRIAFRLAGTGSWVYDKHQYAQGQWLAVYGEITSAATNSVVGRMVHGGRDKTVSTGKDVGSLTHVQVTGDCSMMRFAVFDRHLTETEIAGCIEALYDLVETEDILLFAGIGQSNEAGRTTASLGTPTYNEIEGAYVQRISDVAETINITDDFNRWRTPANEDVGSDGTKWGLQLPFFNRMRTVHQTDQKVAWIKMGISGQGWVRDWDPDLASWNHWEQAEEMLTNGLRTIRGFGFRIKFGGFFFLGGETDAGVPETEADVLATLHQIGDLLVSTVGVGHPPFYIGVISNDAGWGSAGDIDTVQDALIQFAEEYPNAIAIPVSDASVLTPGSDGHFDLAGNNLIGARVADYVHGALTLSATPRTFPRECVQEISWHPQSAVAVTKSPFSFAQQVQKFGGQRRVVSIKLKPLTPTQAKEWVAFFLSLNGPQGTFYLSDTIGQNDPSTARGLPLINGGSQTGKFIDTDGWTASTENLSAGEFVSIGDRLHTVLRPVNANALGAAELELWPEVSTAPADDDVIEVYHPRGIFRLAESPEYAWSMNRLMEGASFTAVEVL